MRFKTLLGIGIVIFIAGIISLLVSNNINSQVGEGRVKISSSQEKVDRANSFFSAHPRTQEIGKGFTSSSQEKIHAGTLKADKYEKTANTLQIVGIILLIAGAGVIVTSFITKRKTR